MDGFAALKFQKGEVLTVCLWNVSRAARTTIKRISLCLLLLFLALWCSKDTSEKTHQTALGDINIGRVQEGSKVFVSVRVDRPNHEPGGGAGGGNGSPVAAQPANAACALEQAAVAPQVHGAEHPAHVPARASNPLPSCSAPAAVEEHRAEAPPTSSQSPEQSAPKFSAADREVARRALQSMKHAKATIAQAEAASSESKTAFEKLQASRLPLSHVLARPRAPPPQARHVGRKKAASKYACKMSIYDRLQQFKRKDGPFSMFDNVAAVFERRNGELYCTPCGVVVTNRTTTIKKHLQASSHARAVERQGKNKRQSETFLQYVHKHGAELKECGAGGERVPAASIAMRMEVHCDEYCVTSV